MISRATIDVCITTVIVSLNTPFWRLGTAMNRTARPHPEFPHEPPLIHLNHAGVGPWPLRAVQAVERFARENLSRGSRGYPGWLELEERLRRRAARLINAPAPEQIALLKNTSEGLSLVAWGLSWEAGDNVVVASREFPSNRIVWESLAAVGVECRRVDIDRPDLTPEEALLAAVDPRTRLLSVSAVQYADGLRMELPTLAQGCRERGVLFCVDAIQQLGALPFDAQACGADFVIADGHKWMLGPEGLGLFYCREELWERLQLRQYGWHMVERMGEFERSQWEPARSARRFEAGSPNLLAAHALEASRALLEEEGMERVGERILALTEHLLERIDREPLLEALTPRAQGRRSGIVTFRHRGADPEPLWRRLLGEGVLCAARGGGIRFSPHYYLEPTALDEAVDRLLALA